MRLVELSEVTPGMTLARDVLGPLGEPLLRAGTHLDDKYIAALRQRNIEHAYVHGDDDEPADVDDVVSEETRTAATQALAEEARRFGETGQIDIMRLQKHVDELLDAISSRPQVLAKLAEIRTADNVLLSHSINVAILSLKTAIHLGWSRRWLRKLGLGTLLHDVGKLMVPKEILNKPGQLTEEEWAIMREHPRWGWESLRKLPDVSVVAAHVAYEHHERLDGSGYPRALVGEKILPEARVAMVADVYDAILNNRSYREGRGLQVALDVIASGAGTHFDERVVRAFLKNIAFCLVGNHVRLSNGDTAIVVDYRRGAPPNCPIVKLISDEQGRQTGGEQLDLSTHPDITVQSLLPDRDGTAMRMATKLLT